MKVLHVYKSYYPDTTGGVEQVICQLGQSLSHLGVESRIFTLSPAPFPAILERPEGCVHRSKTSIEIASNTMSISALPHFREQAKWADIIHYQFPWPFGDVLHLLGASRKASVVTYQSDIVRQSCLRVAYAPVMHRFLKSVDRVVATSPQYRDTSPVLARLGRPAVVIPNGIDESSFTSPSAEFLTRWRDQLGEGFLLFVGVLRYYKGLETLLDAADGLVGRVVIAGDGPLAASLAESARSRGLSNVHFTGWVSDQDKMALMALSAGFVFPSHLRSEAFGMSMVEAAMVGKPLISCEIGTGTSYVNLNGESGWVVPPGDPHSLRQAMRTLLADPARAQALGRGARARYERLFTARRMAASYKDLYSDILQARLRQAAPQRMRLREQEQPERS